MSSARIGYLLSFFLIFGWLCTARAVAEENVPEEAAFDVFLGSEYRGLLVAKYSPDIRSTWIEIQNPDEIVEIVPALTDSKGLVELLRGRIEKEREIQGVGKVTVNPKIFAIHLSLAPETLLTSSLESISKLSNVDSVTSFRQDITSSFIGGAQNGSAVTSATSLNFENYWLYSNFAVFREGPENLQELTANTLIGRYKLTGGGIRTAGYQLLPSLDIYGAGVSTVTDLLPLDRALRGNEFKIFVPVPGRVEFYRSGVLLDSQLLPYGNQEVDTTRFPDGAYYVDVVFPQGAGGAPNIRRYFSRSGILVPRGFPTIVVNAGKMRDQFRNLDTDAVMTHIDWRAFDWGQLEFGGYQLNSQTAGIAGIRALVGDTILGSSIVIPSQKAIGYSFLLTGNLWGVNYGGTYEKASFLDLPLENQIETPDPINLPVNQNGQRERFLRAGENYSFTVSKHIDPIDLVYEATSTKDELLTEYFYRGPTLRWQILNDGATNLNLQISRYQTQNGIRDYAMVTFQYRFGVWSDQVQATYAKDDTRRDRVISNYLNFDQRQQRSGLGTRAQLRNEVRAQPGAAQGNSSLDVTHGFRSFSAGVYGQQSGDIETGESPDPTGALILGSSFTLSGDGKASLSPPDLGYSMIVVHFGNVEQEVEMEVLIDETVSATVRGGGSVALGISPYLTHKIRVRPTESSSLVSYNTQVQKVSANPGAVVHLNFASERVVVVIGKIVDANGRPLANKKLKGPTELSYTESDGSFQVELADEKLLSIESGSLRCPIALPNLKEIEYYVDLGTLTCADSEQGR